MIHWGIIGAGNIAHQFAQDFNHVTKGKILGVASRKLSKARDFAKKHHIKKSYGSYEAIVTDQDIDVIYIATPHVFHKEHTRLALENNKHVLCEKPFAMNRTDGEELFNLAKEKNLFIMEGMWMLFQPAIKQVKKWISDGEIGPIKSIKASFGFKAPFNASSRLFNKDLGGGSLLDVGIYPLTLVDYLLEETPKEIRALTTIGDTEIDEQTSVIMSFTNNKLASISSSIVTNFSDDAFIYGTKGHIHIPNFWYSTKAFLIKNDTKTTFNRQTTPYGYAFEAQHVNHRIMNGFTNSDQVPPEKTLQILTTMDKIREIIGLEYPTERK